MAVLLPGPSAGPWEPSVQVAGGPDEPRLVDRSGELGDSGNGKRESFGAQRVPGKAKYRGVPVAELLADYRLALVSRCLDDREITLQKQSRGFFHISGAGHEALCLGLARSLRPSYDWFLPYYRDRALVLALGVTPTESLLQAVGAATDPASGGRQMPCHFGSRRLNILTQSSPTGSQCLPAVGCAEAGRYISRRSHEGLPGCSAHDDEIVYVSMGEGATSEGEFWESLNTACSFRLPVLYVVADNGYAISVPARQQSPGPISELVKGFPDLAVHRIDGRDYFEVRKKAPVFAFLSGHSEQVPPEARTGRRGLDRPYCGAGKSHSRRADPFAR